MMSDEHVITENFELPETLPICRYHEPQYMLKVSAKIDVPLQR